MKNLVLIACLALFAGSAFAQKQLKTFDELMEALNSGNTVQAVFHYHKCEVYVDGKQEETMPEIIGAMHIEVYEYFGKMAIGNPNAFVVSSTSKFIKNPLGDGYVHNYAKVKVAADNSVTITAQYVNPETFEADMDEQFKTVMNNGKNDAGAYFYIN